MSKHSAVFLFLLLLLIVIVPTLAQEATELPDPLPEATAEATPEITPEMMPDTLPDSMGAALPDRVTVSHEGLFPEGIEWDSINYRFLVSSTSEGTVYAVMDDGTMTPFVLDSRIPASFGLEVDETRNRLLVAATDPMRQGFLGIYDLKSGTNLEWVDFSALTPNDREHFVNDVAVDAAGNAYVTDSLAGVIYRVGPAGNPFIFLEDESFSTRFALNGIVYHAPSNSLIAVRVPDLIRIPLDNPTGFTTVTLPMPLVGADGIVPLNDTTLAVVTNNPPAVYRIESSDQFATGTITGRFEPGNVNPTTVAERGGEAYVLYSYLNAEEETRVEFPIQRVTFSDMDGAAMEATPEATAEQ